MRYRDEPRRYSDCYNCKKSIQKEEDSNSFMLRPRSMPFEARLNVEICTPCMSKLNEIMPNLVPTMIDFNIKNLSHACLSFFNNFHSTNHKEMENSWYECPGCNELVHKIFKNILRKSDDRQS